MANREVESEFIDDGEGDVGADGGAIVTVSALEAITRSEVAMQLDAAHRYPRSIRRFLLEATELATYDEDIAASCMYGLKRAGKIIEGKSVRLAEICASTWGNLHVAARVLEAEDENAVAQAVVWDLQRNVRITVDAKRGILRSDGRTRYDADMIRVTGMAAQSIALRNAVFRIVPGAYTDQVYQQARATAVGTQQTLVAKREKWLERLAKQGATAESVFAKLGVTGAADIGLEHLATLIAASQSIKNNELTVESAFPPVVVVVTSAPASASAGQATPAAAEPPDGRRVKVGTGKRGATAAAPPAAASNASSAPAKPAETPPPAAAKNASPAAPTAGRETAAPATAAPGAGAPPAASPEGPAGGVDPAALVLNLALVDDAWKTAPDARAIVDSWSEPERAEAWAWTQKIINNTGSFAEQMQRPAFTNIDGPPEGE